MLFTMLQRITFHKKLYNIFAYATANSFRWSLIGPLNIEVQIAGKNGILFEFYYLVESNFRAIAMSSCMEMGGVFSENYNLIPSSYSWGGERYLHNIPLQIWIFAHAMKLKLEPVEWSFMKRGNKWRHNFSYWLFTDVRPSRSDQHVDKSLFNLICHGVSKIWTLY